MDEWHVGDPEDWGDSVGVPDIPYMGYLNNDDDEEEDERPPRQPNSNAWVSGTLSDEAWRLEGEGRFEEALVMINRAIEKGACRPNDFNRKGIILQDLCRYEEALEFYDKALSFGDNGVFRANKADCMVASLRVRKVLGQLEREHLDFIDEALRILPDGEDESAFHHMKGCVYEKLEDTLNARLCHLRGSGMFDRADEAERLVNTLNPSKTYINITGTHNYRSFEPFSEGVIVDLVREPENPHDGSAIRVEISGETVGYVANSWYKLFRGLSGAWEIKDNPSTRARVLFIVFNDFIVAELI